MSFATLQFVFFLPIAVVAYYLCPGRYRWALLLSLSCYFYMAFVPWYILLLFLLIGIDFIAARQIESSRGHMRRVYLVVSILSTMSMLFVFKYFNFFNGNVDALAHFLHWNYSIGALKLLLPIGLSFHTFQSLSYVIEVYKGNYKAERHLGIYALYVMFFPQLVAGPIERPQHLLPQLKERGAFRWSNIFSGLSLVMWGFFKKLVIADRLALSVNFVWANFAHLPGLSIVLASIFFAFQLYADFSGYSDIARGSARMLGIDVMQNFNRPYVSRSISEFWRRWHISLSSWFRDYLYIPLGGNRKGIVRQCINTMIVFSVMGLWHGAGWTYIVLGLLHGVYISIRLFTHAWRERFAEWAGLATTRLYAWWQILCTFGLVVFGWVFFRAPDLPTAIAFIQGAFLHWSFSPGSFLYGYFWYPYDTLGFGRSDLILSCGAILALLFVEYAEQHAWWHSMSERVWVRSFAYTLLILSIVVFGVFTTQQFIYFQF